MKRIVSLIGVALAIAGALYALGYLPHIPVTAEISKSAVPVNATKQELAPAVTVARAKTTDLQETVLVTGTLVPRLEVLVAPEVEGLRVVELLADEADRVEQGQVLARLEKETLKVQLAQNDASAQKADAAIAQAKSNIASAEARDTESRKALDRALPLKSSGVLSESTLDQRESAARIAAAASGFAGFLQMGLSALLIQAVSFLPHTTPYPTYACMVGSACAAVIAIAWGLAKKKEDQLP